LAKKQVFCAGIYIIIPTFAPDKKKKKKLPESIKIFQMPYLTIEKKASIFAEFGGKATNTGSIEAQVALLTERISQISKHLQANKHDHSTQRGLMRLVGQRKRLLSYLQKNNLQGYRALIEKLGLRK
jgi:small subunit ribosomal protein S15